MDRSRDSEAVPETRGAPVDRQRQILIRHYNRTGCGGSRGCVGYACRHTGVAIVGVILRFKKRNMYPVQKIILKLDHHHGLIR